MKTLELEDGDRMRSLISSQGVTLFEDISGNLEEHRRNFDKNIVDKEVANGKEQSKVKVVQGEKFEIHEENDFKQWERYDIMHFVVDDKKDNISKDVMPSYVAQELKLTKNQQIDYKMVSNVKSGLKTGRKLSNADSRWVEKWFEVKCKDISDSVVTDIIVKNFYKFWTNIETNQIEGESCIQILKDGSSEYQYDALLYELKGEYKFENILDKKGSLKTTKTVVSKVVPKVYAIQDSKSIVQNADKNLDIIL